MKKNEKNITRLSLAALILTSCANKEAYQTPSKLFASNPVTVNWSNTNSNKITSYQANVSIYSKNSRKDQGFIKTQSYRMAVKTIDGVTYSRIDMNEAFADGKFRSVISNGNESMIIDSKTNEIQARIAVPKESMDLSFIGNETGFGRMNLNQIRKESQRLAFDITDDEASSELMLSLPSSLFNNGDNLVKRISTVVKFDTVNETMTEMETKDIQSDGTSVTTTVTPVYNEHNGELIKVGSVTVIDTKVADKVDGFDSDYPVYNSAEDIPVLSDEDFEKLKESGNISVNNNVVFGDPSDLSNSVTVVEIYEDVKVNQTEDENFRLIMEVVR